MVVVPLVAQSSLFLFLFFACTYGSQHTETGNMAANTMDAIKKKMQAMKLEKESAADKADQLEQQLAGQKELNGKVSTNFFLVVE